MQVPCLLYARRDRVINRFVNGLPCHGIRYTKARDAIHPCHGIRYIATGYGTPLSRDVIHSFRGIRYTGFTGYGALEKSMKWLETFTQQAFQDDAKID